MKIRAAVLEQFGAPLNVTELDLAGPQAAQAHCRSEKTNLCLAIREQQNLGYLPDGTTRLSREGGPIRHFMGTSTFAGYTVMPEIALAKISASR